MHGSGPLDQLDEAVELLEKVVVGLEPDLLAPEDVARGLRASARGTNLLTALQVAVAPRLVGRDPAQQVARLTGTSLGVAQAIRGASKELEGVPASADQFAAGDLSLAAASEIARTEAAAPGSESELLAYAERHSLTQLRQRARVLRQDATGPEELEKRRHEAREFRSWVDELGMVRFRGALEPHLGVPFISRLEAETDRVFKEASREGRRESHYAYAADAFARMLWGAGTGPSRRPELVLLVDLESFLSGSLVPGGVSKIPGVGPLSPSHARDLARDAIVSALVHDGTGAGAQRLRCVSAERARDPQRRTLTPEVRLGFASPTWRCECPAAGSPLSTHTGRGPAGPLHRRRPPGGPLGQRPPTGVSGGRPGGEQPPRKPEGRGTVPHRSKSARSASPLQRRRQSDAVPGRNATE